MGIIAGVVGATGYVGGELLRILSQHPEVKKVRALAKDFQGMRLDHVFPHLRGQVHGTVEGMEALPEVAATADVVFTALPHGLSAPVVREVLAQGKRVIDLAADFRFPDAGLYEAWYGAPHQAPEFLKEAVYGLPELFRSAVSAARLVANPGCYPTAALLALAPLLKHGLVVERGIVVDAKSGVSGAGRAPGLGNLFAECNESIRPYSVGTHRHTPEIAHYASVLAGGRVELLFVPHLVPLTRGILSTVYAELSRPLDTATLRRVFCEFYEGERFVVVAEEGEWPQTKWVPGTNTCFLGVAACGRRAVVAAAIDNLVKGAAGQAVQNMNLMFGFEEGLGLPAVGVYP